MRERGLVSIVLSKRSDHSLGASPESGVIRVAEEQVLPEHYFFPVFRRESIPQKFYELAAKWKEDTRFNSSLTEICMHPAYQQIIGMGQAALPLIFKELECEVANWFWALRAITRENPVLPSSAGNFNEMAKDWLLWGRVNGYEW